jgi:hypothetical protein
MMDPVARTAGAPPADGAPDVWAHQERIGRQLAAWAVCSVAMGAGVAAAGHRRGSPATRAFGMQNAAWGAVDLGIATFGELRRRGRLATLDDPYSPSTLAAEHAQLRRILVVNAGLDVGYIAAGVMGVRWALRRATAGSALPSTAGHAAAIVLQGAFLLVFDSRHAMALGNDGRQP